MVTVIWSTVLWSQGKIVTSNVVTGNMGTSNMVKHWVFKKFISVVSQVVFIWSGLHLIEMSHSLVECRVSKVDMMTSLLLRKHEDFAKCVIRDVVWTRTGSNCMEPSSFTKQCSNICNVRWDFWYPYPHLPKNVRSKKFINGLRIDRNMAMSLWTSFWPILYMRDTYT